jgi:hypothetical protein
MLQYSMYAVKSLLKPFPASSPIHPFIYPSYLKLSLSATLPFSRGARSRTLQEGSYFAIRNYQAEYERKWYAIDSSVGLTPLPFSLSSNEQLPRAIAQTSTHHHYHSEAESSAWIPCSPCFLSVVLCFPPGFAAI